MFVQKRIELSKKHPAFYCLSNVELIRKELNDNWTSNIRREERNSLLYKIREEQNDLLDSIAADSNRNDLLYTRLCLTNPIYSTLSYEPYTN